MSTSVASPGDEPVAASTPREVRAVLIGEEVADFDREYRRMLAEAAETLDLTGVLEMLKRWRPVAWSSENDPGAHRRMLDKAARLLAGEDVPTEPWHVAEVRLGR